MIHYSVKPRDSVFVKSYGFFSFAKNMGKTSDNNISKNLSGKCSQKLLDHAKQSAASPLKIISKRFIQKAAGATADLISIKIIK